jgi:hypothetical protein
MNLHIFCRVESLQPETGWFEIRMHLDYLVKMFHLVREVADFLMI